MNHLYMIDQPKISTWVVVLSSQGVVTTISRVVAVAGPAFHYAVGEGLREEADLGLLCFRMVLCSTDRS